MKSAGGATGGAVAGVAGVAGAGGVAGVVGVAGAAGTAAAGGVVLVSSIGSAEIMAGGAVGGFTPAGVGCDAFDGGNASPTTDFGAESATG